MPFSGQQTAVTSHFGGRKSVVESSFDAKMRAHLAGLRGTAMSRRAMLSGAAATAAATAATLALKNPVVAGPRPGVAGLTLLAQNATTVVFGLEGDVRGLEPALAYDFTANPVVCQISEGLLKFNPDGSLSPLLAESWEHPDALTYTYTLRQGVTFHDGSTMTTDDVIASIARVRDPEVAGPMAWMYDDPGATVEAVDDKTIKITLARPSALFQYVVATTAGHVVPKAAIEKLVKAGGFDKVSQGRRAALFDAIGRAMDSASQTQEDRRHGQGAASYRLLSQRFGGRVSWLV